MQSLFQILLYQPIYNAMVGLYALIPDMGVVILILTILIKLALYPLTKSSLTSQKALLDMQPKIDALKKEHKEDPQRMSQELMKLYKENKVNPMSSCLPLLIQLPIFLALFWVLRDGFNPEQFTLLYAFVPVPESINPISLGFVDLSKPNVILALLAGVAQFWQAYMMSRKRAPQKSGEGSKDENMLAMMNKQMLYVMPAVTTLIGFQFPGGVTLYWFLSNLFMALQQQLLYRKKKDPDVIEGQIVETK